MTLIICNDYRRAEYIAEEFNISKKEYRYLSSGTSSKDVMNASSVCGYTFDRMIYDFRPSNRTLAYLSINMREGATITNYNNYKLKLTLGKL